MKIVLTKLDPLRHRFQVMFDGEISEDVVLETKSMLRHDLAHFAYETEGSIRDGFYGRLYCGVTLREMRTDSPHALSISDIAWTERISAHIQTKADFQSSMVIDGLHNMATAEKSVLPRYVTDDLLRNSRSRFMQLIQQWEGLRVGGEMVLVFDLET